MRRIIKILKETGAIVQTKTNGASNKGMHVIRVLPGNHQPIIVITTKEAMKI